MINFLRFPRDRADRNESRDSVFLYQKLSKNIIQNKSIIIIHSIIKGEIKLHPISVHTVSILLDVAQVRMRDVLVREEDHFIDITSLA